MLNEWDAVNRVKPLLNKEVIIIDKEGNVLEQGVMQLVSGNLYVVGSLQSFAIATPYDVCNIEVEGNIITILDTGGIGSISKPWQYEKDLEI